ncbi:MAG: NAD(P)/FAD-dependent oxidoreductase [Thermodesulfobacteriota bacterium]
MRYDYDVIVVGAGPAGSATALYSAERGLRVLLLDRRQFPREKICGDGLSRDCFSHLRRLGVLDEVERSVHADIRTALLVAPNGKGIYLEIPAPLYVCRRRIFDDILFRAARQKVDSLEGCTVRNVLMEGGRVCGIEGHRSEKKRIFFTARMIVGADGIHSVVSRRTSVHPYRPKRWMAGVRAYCSGIPGLQHAVEFYFIRGFLPGYFWIFPTGDGTANIGLCLLCGGKSESPIHLRGAFQSAMNSPSVRKRLRGARILGEIQGARYPLADSGHPVAGNGYLLVGDAARLASPLTGEGVSKAMLSGQVAAEVLAGTCLGSEGLGTGHGEYERRLWDEMGERVKAAYRIRRFVRFPPVINLVIDSASRFPDTRDWLSSMASAHDPQARMELTSPFTYLRMLWRIGLSRKGKGT